MYVSVTDPQGEYSTHHSNAFELENSFPMAEDTLLLTPGENHNRHIMSTGYP